LIEAYGITIPSIRVFRRGIMSDYRGPQDTDGIAKYIVEDAKVWYAYTIVDDEFCCI
jgi:hypothetical protein